MEIQRILKSLKNDEISINTAKKLLSLYSIEEVENFAKIDINRRKRHGIPEVIFAETKELEEIKKIIEKTIEKTDPLIVSRIRKDHYKKIITFSKNQKIKVKKGQNSSSILLYMSKTIFNNIKMAFLLAMVLTIPGRSRTLNSIPMLW